MKPRSAKTKGTKLEKWVADKLQSIGVSTARRQPGSGIYQGFEHDVSWKLSVVGRVIVECKSWKFGWRTGNKAMGAAELLVIKADRDDPYVYCTWAHYSALVKCAVELEALHAESAAGAPRPGPDGQEGFVAMGDRPRH